MKSNFERFKGELALLITAMFWGYGFVATSKSLAGFSPYQLLFFRFLIGSLVLALFFFKNFKNLKWPIIKKGAFVGIFFFLGFVFQTVGIQYTTPSRNAFLTSVNVIIVPIISYFIFKRKIDFNEGLGAFLSLLGIGFLTLQLGGKINIGDILTLICAVFFALQIFYTAIYIKGENPIDMTIVQVVTCTILSLIFTLFEGKKIVFPKGEVLSSIIFLGIVSTVIATILQMYGQKYTTETRASIFMSLEAFWGTIFSIIILGELVTFRLVIGGAIILSAILISELKPFKKNK